MPQPSRRALLSAVGASLAGCAGCLDLGGGGDGTPTLTPADPPPTASPAPSASPASPSPTETYTTPTEVERTDDFYVENFDDRESVLSLSLVARGEVAVEGRYRVPGGVALHWPDVGREGTTYEVTADFQSGEALAETWAVEDCPNAYEGNRNAAVQIREGRPEYRENGCDAISVGHELPRAAPAQYRLD